MTEPEDYAIYASQARAEYSADFIEKAERYLEEGKNTSKQAENEPSWDRSAYFARRAQNQILGSIAASLIALAKRS